MDNVQKVYSPTVLTDTPFPVQSVDITSPVVTDNTYGPTTINDQAFPVAVVANDLVNSSLNTQTRKILGEYSFTPTGALQVGKYHLNQSGDIRISPDGITGRNSTGANTFTILGTTGDATFMGNLMAGTIMGGDNKVTIDSVNNNGRILVYDESNVCRIVIGYIP